MTGAVLLLAGGVYAFRVASILAAYRAKMLCSEVLLAHRDPHVVLNELEVDDLTPLRYISASVDASTRTATASVAGLVSHHAAYREERGCALLFDLRRPSPARRYMRNGTPGAEL
jgi:hypothetical protein